MGGVMRRTGPLAVVAPCRSSALATTCSGGHREPLPDHVQAWFAAVGEVAGRADLPHDQLARRSSVSGIDAEARRGIAELRSQASGV